MTNTSFEPALVPSHKPSFLLDWELTMRCNLDCTYCGSGLYGGHDNTTQHPFLEECVKTIDFMFEYVDLYMRHKSICKEVVLNIYGGESFFHPNVVEIYKLVREKHAAYDYPLTVTTTTNLIVGKNLLERIIPNIDEFTCSYHTEASQKQKDLFRKNLLLLQERNKKIKVIIIMHSDQDKWDDALDMIEFCEANNINFLARQIDHRFSKNKFNYNSEQLNWFGQFYSKKSFNSEVSLDDASGGNLTEKGRACCGGRQICMNQNYKERHFFVDNKFKSWSCSVNWFFVYIKQITGEIFVNKDCKMNFNNEVGPIGHLSKYQELIDFTKTNLEKNTLPVITCAKENCLCGLCAPKAANRETFDKIFKKYIKTTTS